MSIRRLSKPLSANSLRLFCFPPAGAGASFFYPYLALDSPAVSICPVAYPGREDRYRESLPDSVSGLAATLADELGDTLAPSYAVLGYSMGAIVGYEAILRWRERGLLEPKQFVVVAASAPQRPLKHGIQEQDAAGFRQAMFEMGGTPKELLDNAEAMSVYEPVLRSDFRNCDAYTPTSNSQLSCPIKAIASASDPLMKVGDVAAWRERTSGRFEQDVLPDRPHIFSREDMTRLMSEVCDSLR